MPVGLPSTAVTVTAESDADLEAVLLFCLGGLTLSLYFIHLVPIATAGAITLLAYAG
jgi:hypothetical protein